MPANRHHKSGRSAKALPSSRLPLGTPSLDRRDADSRTSHHSDSSDRSTSSTSATSDHTSGVKEKHTNMSDATSEHQDSAAARAQAKLRRQEERIQQSDPLNKPPPPVEKPRAQRKPVWKPFDMSELMPPPPVPGVDEVRVNRYPAQSYPAQSRDTSLSRSMSSVSQQTTATGGFEIDRNDSATTYDSAGFQMYSGRRRNRQQALTDQSSYGDPPAQEKPKTVEAKYDENEILEVFKKHLPGLDYLATNAGMADGEVHFVQHPNGDVSAQMWSAKDYQWWNIGSFSNIRKRVEGQLAGERLKSETAWQKLQQHTLSYFRVLAKQREALAMGKTFGQDEIKQALPEPQQSEDVSPRGQQKSQPQFASSARPAFANLLQDPPTGPRADRVQFTNLNPFVKSEDPFSATQSAIDTMSPTSRSQATSAIDQQDSSSAAWSKRFNALFAVPLAGSSIKATAKPYEPLVKPKTISTGSTLVPATPRSHSQREMPPETRQAMLDQLNQLGDRASKRSMSQLNLANLSRTVMNDPYQHNDVSGHDDGCTSPPLSMSITRPNKLSTTNSGVPVAFSQTGDIKVPTASRHNIFRTDFEELCANWEDRQTGMPVTERKTSVLTNGSVPDTGYDKNITAPHSSEPIGSGKATTKPYDLELNDWWTSGKKFARQEEFYQHIMATDTPKKSSTLASSTPQKTSFGTPVSQPRPIGAPALTRNADARQAGSIAEADKVDVTRFLIPVYENLASYTQGPNRRDYWCRWSQPPEWCIDRGPKGNESFFDSVWGQPPARVGRDPRYRSMPGELRFGGFSPGYSKQSSAAVGSPSAVRGTTGSFGSVGMASGGPSGRLVYGNGRY